jgi:hypothetical protein
VIASEKKRALWSLAIGAAVGFSYFGWCAVPSNARLRDSVRKCEAALSGFQISEPALDADPDFLKLNETDQKYVLARMRNLYTCDPADVSITNDQYPDINAETFVDNHLTDVQSKMIKMADEADRDRDTGRTWGIVLFLVFCLPLVWYFLLDRLKEVGAAIRKP